MTSCLQMTVHLMLKPSSEMQENAYMFSATCEDFSHTVSTKNAEVMYQPTPSASYTGPTITVGHQKFDVADDGNNFSRTV